MTAPDAAPQEKSGGLSLGTIIGTSGGAGGVGIAALLYESFRVDKCAEVLLAQQESYDELLKAMIELVGK